MDDAPEFWPLPENPSLLAAPVGAMRSGKVSGLGTSDPRQVAAELLTLATQAEQAGLPLISALLRSAERRMAIAADA